MRCCDCAMFSLLRNVVFNNAVQPKVSSVLLFLFLFCFVVCFVISLLLELFFQPRKIVLTIQRKISKRKTFYWTLHHAINRIYRGRIRVFFDYSISWGFGLSSASLCEGECYTEFLLFCSKVKSEKRILLFPSPLLSVVSPWRSRPYFNSPRSFC